MRLRGLVAGPFEVVVQEDLDMYSAANNRGPRAPIQENPTAL